MSIWSDIQERSAGEQIRKEDFFPCELETYIIGKGAKFPKRFAVPDDVRYQRCSIMLYTGDRKNLIYARFLVWAYIVGHKTFNDFLLEYARVKSENNGFIYIEKDGDFQLIDKSREAIDELLEFVKKNNENVCGKPMPLDFI